MKSLLFTKIDRNCNDEKSERNTLMKQQKERAVKYILIIWAFARGVSHIDPNNLTKTLIKWGRPKHFVRL